MPGCFPLQGWHSFEGFDEMTFFEQVGDAARTSCTGAVAGTAAAVIGSITTLGGAILGALIDSTYNGTLTPWAIGGTIALKRDPSAMRASTIGQVSSTRRPASSSRASMPGKGTASRPGNTPASVSTRRPWLCSRPVATAWIPRASCNQPRVFRSSRSLTGPSGPSPPRP